ncbi:peptidyl-prolyl cis-trans isomerase NIMA-interacting 4 isoform X2 [Physeter macrocephalus]|uniref:Peptidyl-prolyl cis-trans isomerase NIMA-interacting 4 isoform X2 n=1 Tax=Physeter macrocephalus TaxID=9755 RepID=A0A9W2WEV6_PHYMC|nr:peptidyl-prolyl cis-trans isomerase NIMA-interacting 4 isoform X2 [Physeter catodon]
MPPKGKSGSGKGGKGKAASGSDSSDKKAQGPKGGGNAVKRDRQSGECHGKTEAETGVMHLHAKELQGSPVPPEAKRGMEQILSHSLQKETNPADTLISDFWTPEL